MVRPYGMDLRERVVAAVEAGESRRSASRRFGVSASVAIKWLQRVKATGSVKPSKMGGYRRPALAGERDWILARFAEAGSDLTVRGLAGELAARGVKAGPYAVWSFFKREGLTFKKKPARGRAGPAGRGAQAGAVEAPPGQA
jgi:transposase